MKYNFSKTRTQEESGYEEFEMSTDDSPPRLNSSKIRIDKTIIDLLEDEQKGVEKVRTIQETRRNFISLAREHCKGHTEAANFYNIIFVTLNLTLTLLTAFATVLSTQELSAGISQNAITIVTGLATLISAVIGFLKPADRRNEQLEFAKEIKVLMFRMIECESEEMYDRIWKDFFEAILTEPLMRKNIERKLTTY